MKKNYNIIAIDLRKQKVPYADSKAIQQIKFIDFKDKNTTFCAIIERSKEAIQESRMKVL